MEKDLNKSTEETSTEAPVAEQAVRKEKSLKSNKWFWVAIVVVIAILAGLTYYIVSSLTTKTADSEDTSLAASTRFASPSALVDKVKPEMQGAVVEIATTDGAGGKTSDGYGVYGVPSYLVKGHKFSNLPAESSGAGYKGDSKQAEKNFASLEKFFTDNKFKLLSSASGATGPIAWNAEDVTYVKYATYESSNLVCMVWHADASGTPLQAHVASVGCGDKESYSKAAKILDEYYVAYTKGESDPSDKIVLGAPRTGDSNTEGYKVAVVYQEDTKELDVQFEGLYYKKPGSNEWTYFLGSHGWIDCPDFDTDDVKKAFDGFNCYDKVSDKIINVGTGTKAPELK